MALYKVATSVDRLESALCHAAQTHGFDAQRVSSDCLILSWPRLAGPVEIQFNLSAQTPPNHSLLKLESRLSRWRMRRLLFAIALIPFFAALGAWSNPLNGDMAFYGFMAGVILLAVGVLGWMILYNRHVSRTLQAFMATVKQQLPAEFKQVEPFVALPNDRTMWLGTTITLIGLVSVLGLMASWFVGVVLGFLLLFAVISWMIKIQTRCTMQGHYHALHEHWTGYRAMLLMALMLSLSFGMLAYIRYTQPTQAMFITGISDSLNHLLLTITQPPWTTGEAADQAAGLVESGIFPPRPVMYILLLKTFVVLMFPAWAIYLHYSIIQSRMVHELSDDAHVQIYFDRPIGRFRLSGLIVVYLLMTATISWIYCWLCLEIFCYLLLGVNILLPQVSGAIAFEIATIQCGEFSRSAAVALTAAGYLVLCFPGLMVWLRTVGRVGKLIRMSTFPPANDFSQLPAEVGQWLTEICRRLKQPRPRIHLLRSPHGPLHAYTDLSGRRPVITMPRICLEQYDADEIRARKLKGIEIVHRNDLVIL